MKKILSILLTAIIVVTLTSPVSAIEYSNYFWRDPIFSSDPADSNIPEYAEEIPTLSAVAGIENELWNSDI